MKNLTFDEDTLYCRVCGSTNVSYERQVRYYPNTDEDVDANYDERSIDANEIWCDDCMEYQEACTIDVLWDSFMDIYDNEGQEAGDAAASEFLDHQGYSYDNPKEGLTQWFEDHNFKPY